MDSLLPEIQAYWTKRAASYSEMIEGNLADAHAAKWSKVLTRSLAGVPEGPILDIGTGPGFFAILLAQAGYAVTAIDYTPSMLDKARDNAGALAERIDFLTMDAQALTFPDNSFAAVVTRNLTWNLEEPDRAYCEWYRVLKPGGILLNFDAAWYKYLFDPAQQAAYTAARQKVAEQGAFDYESYEDAAKMEAISRQLVLSPCDRPAKDLELLKAAGFAEIAVEAEIWQEVWDELEKLNFAGTPLFLLRARKG